MSSADRTRDHDQIRRWVEERGGIPTIVKGTEGLLRIDFIKGAKSGGREENLEEVGWDQWFQIFDESGLTFLYSPERDSKFFKLVRAEAEEPHEASTARSSRARGDEGGDRVVYRVLPDHGDWKVKVQGTEDEESFERKTEAVQYAKEAAREEPPSQVVVHRQDGRIQYESTYGDDPRRRKG